MLGALGHEACLAGNPKGSLTAMLQLLLQHPAVQSQMSGCMLNLGCCQFCLQQQWCILCVLELGFSVSPKLGLVLVPELVAKAAVNICLQMQLDHDIVAYICSGGRRNQKAVRYACLPSTMHWECTFTKNQHVKQHCNCSSISETRPRGAISVL